MPFSTLLVKSLQVTHFRSEWDCLPKTLPESTYSQNDFKISNFFHIEKLGLACFNC